MWKTTLYLLCTLPLFLISACSTIEETEIPTVPIIEEQTGIELIPTATVEIKPKDNIPDPFHPVREHIAQVLEIPLVEVKLGSYEPVDWPNTCLGAPDPGEMCAEAITPGWQAVFNTSVGEIRAHLNKSGLSYRLAPSLDAEDSLTPQPPSSGIEGQILLGSACPGPEKVDQHCPEEPYQATIIVLEVDGNPVTQFNSASDGLFHVVLPPGTYILHPEVMGAFPNAGDQVVVVQDGQFSQVEILIVSQMR